MNEGSRRPGDLEAGFFGDFLLKESHNPSLERENIFRKIER